MASKVVSCTIKGTSSLLMHKFPFVAIDGFEKLSIEEQAEHVAYRTAEGELYVPGLNFQRALVSGATYIKGKGRATMQKPVAACVLISPEYILLHEREYTIDTRPVVIPATKGRVLRHRPRLDEWQITFSIEYDPVLMKEEELRKVVDETGSRVGLLDFRPEKKGPFGRFIVVEWK